MSLPLPIHCKKLDFRLIISVISCKTIVKDYGALQSIYFGPQVYLMWFYVIALVRLSVTLSVFKYLSDRSLVFSEILLEVRGQ